MLPGLSDELDPLPLSMKFILSTFWEPFSDNRDRSGGVGEPRGLVLGELVGVCERERTCFLSPGADWGKGCEVVVRMVGRGGVGVEFVWEGAWPVGGVCW